MLSLWHIIAVIVILRHSRRSDARSHSLCTGSLTLRIKDAIAPAVNQALGVRPCHVLHNR